ncbi:MAG: hypothetical protein ACE5MI_08470 [Acidimicrobiia bacterium]
MAQQPNIEVTDAERPRPEPEPAAPARWSPNRPGEIEGPGDMEWGGAFGRPGPDTGWAQLLVARRQIDAPEGENPELIRELVAAIASARAAYFGRAPVPVDVDFALVLLGLDPSDLPSALVRQLAEGRRVWLDEAAREKVKGRGLLAALGSDVLALSLQELKHRLVVESHATERQ